MIFIFICSSIFCYAQTAETEKKYLSDKYQRGLISLEEYRKLAKNWKDVLSSLGGYPELPYNKQTREIEYYFTFSFQQIDKEIIYNRIIEWAVINFGSIKSVLHYSDLETGKIILKGYFNVMVKKDYIAFWGKNKESIDEKKCYQTYVFTLIDNRLKIEIINLEYKYTFIGYTIGSIYIPSKTINQSIHDLYPITGNDAINWKSNLDMLKQTDIKINLLVENLTKYINNYKADYIY